MSPDTPQDRQEQAEQMGAKSEIEQAQMLQDKLKRAEAKNRDLAGAMHTVGDEVKRLREDLATALDLTHRMLAQSFPAIPYFGEAKGDTNLYLVGRALLKKHNMLEEPGE